MQTSYTGNKPLVYLLRVLDVNEPSEARVHLRVLPQAPQVRADCLSGGPNEKRPCPWTTCRHHLEHPEVSCVLDLVDDRGALTLEEVSDFFGLTRERIRQIEAKVLRKLRANHALLTWIVD